MLSSCLTTDTQNNNKNKRRLTRAKPLRYLRYYDDKHLNAFLYPDLDICSPSPQPLPLPHLSPELSSADKLVKDRRSSKFKTLNSDAFRLPSPTGIYDCREAPHNGKGIVDAQQRFESPYRIDPHRPSADTHRSAVRADTWSFRNVHQTVTSPDQTQKNSRIDINFRSAPPTANSSPMVSPQRIINGDLFSSYHEDRNCWYEPAMPSPFLNTARTENNMASLSHHKPSRKCTSVPSSPSHPKLNIEIPSYHPLPRPPTRSKNSPVKNQWIKGRLIGRGTFGSVYAATHRETGATCAMKEVELCSDDLKSTECVKQLEQEIKVLSHLKHPNIVQYYGSEIVDDRFYIYLEFVHPGSINKYVHEHRRDITEAVVRNFTRHICSGLAYLHGRKTIHRDIKGANLLVDSSGVVKLADFGVAKHLTGKAADLSLKGSPHWMAPELIQSELQNDKRSDLAFAVDIWSLGCTIIEMLTGKPPWSEKEGHAAMYKVLSESPPIPETLSPEGKDFLNCCFQRNPADRPPASKLLEHSFLRNCQQLDVPSSSQAQNFTNQTDKANCPRERYHHKLDKVPRSPNRWSKNGKGASSESGVLPHLEINEKTKGPRYSPTSILEPVTSLSPPWLGPFPKLLVSPNTSNGMSSGAERNVFSANPWA